MRVPWSFRPGLPLGTFFFGLRTLRLPVTEARVHAHVLGKTGSGKSYFLASLFLSMQRAGMAATLIDPYGDLAELVLSHLLAEGRLDADEQRQRLIYLDFPAAAARGRFLPLNVLTSPYDDHGMAEHIAETFRRAWPELATGAPTFENILKHSVIVLRQNRLPLTRLADLLTDAAFRNRLLGRVEDPQVARFFRGRMDAWGRDGAVMKESTLNRADLLTLSPLLRFGLGAPETALNFRRLLDTGTAVVINLAVPSPDTRRLLGCLLTVDLEAAALSRAELPAAQRVPHHLILDEFSQFLAQSEESLTRMLSETRKYGLFCVMAHQNWSQASERLRGALQNVGLEVILKAGRPDAEYSARLLAAVDPLAVKHTVSDAAAEERTHPTFFPLLEQWERHTQAIQTLRTGQAFVRLPDDTVHRVATPTLPRITVASERLAALRESYLQAYFRPMPPLNRPAAAPPAPAALAAIAPPAGTPPPPLRRHHPNEPVEPNPVPAAVPDAPAPHTVFARSDRLRRHH